MVLLPLILQIRKMWYTKVNLPTVIQLHRGNRMWARPRSETFALNPYAKLYKLSHTTLVVLHRGYVDLWLLGPNKYIDAVRNFTPLLSFAC